MSAGSALALGAESGTDGVKPFPLNVPIGGLTQVDPTNNDTLGNYINAWYIFFIGIAGILATIMIMVAGVQWLISRGDAGKITEAKGRMIAAITGLALVFMAYTLLALVNPKLLTIEMPSLTQLTYAPSEDINDGSTTATGQPSSKKINDLNPEVQNIAQKYVDMGCSPTSTVRPGERRHGSGYVMDCHFDENNELFKYVTNHQNFSTKQPNPENIGWGEAYYLNDGAVFVKEPNKSRSNNGWVNNGTGYHWHIEFTGSNWQWR